ncbi:hypothetical protein D5274_00195 [bacterium 1XD42-94]|nr:hypothetical protein [bacterium 1XD42-76]NBK03624.1 hypothetical protein [bacterium 1XD42-94]
MMIQQKEQRQKRPYLCVACLSIVYLISFVNPILYAFLIFFLSSLTFSILAYICHMRKQKYFMNIYASKTGTAAFDEFIARPINRAIIHSK